MRRRNCIRPLFPWWVTRVCSGCVASTRRFDRLARPQVGASSKSSIIKSKIVDYSYRSATMGSTFVARRARM